jgi:16S rRNA (cytidine1402-2'-O)-methyltransferase
LNNIYVTIIPGASSITRALQLSSIPINQYKFLGFVPKTKKGIGDFIDLLKHSTCTSVFFISTHKILLFLEMIATALPDRKIAVCKELTKINERVFIGPSVEVYNKFKESSKNSLGEFVIVVEEETTNRKKSLSELTPDIINVINKLSSELINFAAILILIVASSTTVPKLLSPSATTIPVAPPEARIPAGEQPIIFSVQINMRVTRILFFILYI